MTATDDANNEGPDGTARLQAEAVTDEGALDKLMARGNITSVPTAVASHITDWEGLTPPRKPKPAVKKPRSARNTRARWTRSTSGPSNCASA